MSDTIHRHRSRLGLLACLLILALPAWAESDNQGQAIHSAADAFEDAIAVEVINVDVVVTDRKGRPVSGLTAADFDLRIDGQPVRISNFAAVTASQAQQARASVRRPVQQVTEPSAAAETAEPHALGTTSHMVVFVDNLYLGPGSRQRVLDKLPGFLERQLAAGTRIMTVAQDSATSVIEPFTDDPAVVERALSSILANTPSGIHSRRDWISFVNDTNQTLQNCIGLSPRINTGSACNSCEAQLMALARGYAQDAQLQRYRSVGGLTDVVSALSGVPGRKSVLYVSDGFPEMPGAEAFYFLQEVCTEAANRFQSALREESGVSVIENLAHHANTNRVTFYALEAAGLRTEPGNDAAFGSLSLGRRPGNSGIGPEGIPQETRPNRAYRPSTVTHQIQIANTQGALFTLANETGGKAVLNANDVSGDLEKIGEELSTFYSLGYQVIDKAADRPHRVGVRLASRKRGHELRYRRSFVYKPTQETMGERTLGALLFGMEDNPLGASARTEAGQAPVAGGDYRVPITIEIPRDKLTTLPQEQFQRGRLTVILAAELDDAGKTVRKQELNIARPLDDDNQGDGIAESYRFGVEIDLPRGEHMVGIGLWDRVAQEASFLRLPVHVTTDGQSVGDGAR